MFEALRFARTVVRRLSGYGGWPVVAPGHPAPASSRATVWTIGSAPVGITWHGQELRLQTRGKPRTTDYEILREKERV